MTFLPMVGYYGAFDKNYIYCKMFLYNMFFKHDNRYSF